jgi:O-antigen ligase
MTALTADRLLDPPVTMRSHAVPLLQLFVVTLFVFPSDAVLKAVGGGGYVAALVAYCLFLGWAATTLFGTHNPLDQRYPVRIALCTLWLVSLASYVLMNRSMLSSTQQTGADRWLLQLLAVSGVILVTAEFLPTIEDIHRVLRALIWGGAFCGIVAALQFWLKLDITPYLRMIPGFSLNNVSGDFIGIGSRGALNRVPGTAIDPIELGVVASMLLPLAIYMAIHDTDRSRFRRWFPLACITLAIPTSISRAAILAAVLGLGALMLSLPPARRLIAMVGVLIALAGIFVTAHGLLGTLKQFFLAGTSDDSIAHRVNNYPYVEQLVRQAPWFGQGGGTYIVQEVHILDNQYLTTTIELGLAGLVALIFFFLWPALAAIVARGRTTDPGLRDLCAALAGAELAAMFCSATFDSLSFPMFVNVQALVAGLIGAVWLLIDREKETDPLAPSPRQARWPGQDTRSPRQDSNGTANRRQRAGTVAVEPGGGN